MKSYKKAYSPFKLAFALTSGSLVSQLITSHVVQAATVTVKKSESPSKRVQKYTSVKQLKKSDYLNKDTTLHADSKISVPKSGKYMVKLGDNVSEIANKYGLKTEEVLKWNNLNWQSIILIGQELNLQQPSEQISNSNLIDKNKNTVSAVHSQATQAVNLAIKYAQLGIPYVWGGNSTEGFDCSGLIQNVYNNCGITLGRTTTEQENCVSTSNVYDISDVINIANPGDLLFWGDHGNTYHVAIYIGNGQFVAASHPGTNVGIEKVSNYFKPSFIGKINM